MTFGLSKQQLDNIIAFLIRYPEVEKAVIFGSRALGTFKKSSDVDIAIMGNQVDFSLASRIKFDLEEDTYLPFFFDVVAYQDLDNEALKQNIDRDGIVIYVK